MSRIKTKFIRFGTGTDDTSARQIPANFTPTNYTPVQVGTEGNAQISSNLKGIDNALGTIVTAGDIGSTSWVGPANNTANQSITGFTFANTVRCFDALVDMYIDNGGAGLWVMFKLHAVRKASTWATYEITSEATGDLITGLSFTITSGGQVQVTTGTISGYVSGETRFRAITLSN